MSIKKEKVQTEGIENIFNKIIVKISQIQALRTPKKPDQKRNSPLHIIFKMLC
jgi:hypothetical protein